MIIHSETGKILDASKGALDFYGWTLSDMKSMNIYEINMMHNDEIQEEMRSAVLTKRNYFRFRHITRAGAIKRVDVTSLPIVSDGKPALLSVIETPEKDSRVGFEDIAEMYEFSTDPLMILKLAGDTAQGIVVHANKAARDFLGIVAVGAPLSESILVYDRSNFEAALNRMTGRHYYETDILFKTPHETVVKSIGLNRLFYDADYYVQMQIRPPKGVRVNRLRRSELLAQLDRVILKNHRITPDAGCFGILCLNEPDRLLRTLGKEVYLKMFLSAGMAIKKILGESGDYELLDESMMFFHAGLSIRDERIRVALENLNCDYSAQLQFAQVSIQCVMVSYQGEEYNPEFGLAYKILSELDNRGMYTRIKMITDKDIRKTSLLRDLSSAVGRGELFLLYQPIVDIVRGEIVSLEALVRWNHPKLGIVEPGEFIALAEENDLITQIDEWVIDEVLSQPRDYPVHVNLSTQDLLDERFRNRLFEILKCNSDRIIIELTETTNFELASEISEALIGVNAKLSIDDFGTGYSSMARLTSLDVTSLKIDKSFVMNSVKDIGSASICIAIIRLGKGLNIDVIAEGAETAEQIRFLYRNGCKLIQGYGISRPIRYEAVKDLDVRQFKMGPQDKYGPAGSAGPSRVDFSTAMMVELDENYNFIRMPMSFCRFTGYSQSELREMSILDLVPKEELEICRINCRTLRESGYMDNVVFYMQSADGTRKCVSVTGKKGAAGDMSTYMYIEQNDADEEKIMDIQGTQGAYSTLFHDGPLATVVWRQDFEIIDWNKEAEATFGWTRDEALGQNMIKLLVRKSTFPDHMNVINGIISQGTGDSVNHNVTRSGKRIICRWTNRAVRDRHGNVRFFISMAKDITEDLMKNDLIKQLSSAVEKSGSGVVVTDDAGVVISMNRRFSELSGYSEVELIGSNIKELSSGESTREIYEDLWKTINRGDVWEGEFNSRKKDGSLYWCKNTIVPVKSEWNDTVQFLGIQKDLTEAKAIEEKAVYTRAMLIEQEKLATLGAMMAGISHETYNYMAYVESNLEYTYDIVKKSQDGTAMNLGELLTAVEDTKDGVLRIKEMLQSLKKASRKEEIPQLETFEINKEILMVARLLKNEYKYHAALEIHSGEEIIHVGYPGLLRQVIMNILINAVYAIKARNEQGLGRISISTTRENERIRIVIKDDGIGMDESVRKRIFEPFYTTKQSGEGTGLGLSISKSIITDQYGGDLSCESVAGVGSTFIIEVPEAGTL